MGGGTERRRSKLEKEEEDKEGNEKVGGVWRQSLLICNVASGRPGPRIDADAQE